MTLLDPRIRQRLDAKHQALEKLRPLSKTSVQRLREALALEMTYNSNAIEGNTLSLRETQLVLEQGITIKGKSLREHLEAKDHKEALDFLYEVTSRNRVTLSEQLIRQLHQLVVRETEQEWAGRYRIGTVAIAGASHVPPEGADVPDEMQKLIRWVGDHQRTTYPIELAAVVHHRLVAIHPFVDGNGRTARLAMNVLLMRRGYPLAVVQKNDRKSYYRALQRADSGNYRDLVLLVAKAVERSIELYLRAFNRAPGALITLAEASRGSPYSAKYLNLLAATGKLAAQKKGRNWYTTKKALEDYRRSRLRNRK